MSETPVPAEGPPADTPTGAAPAAAVSWARRLAARAIDALWQAPVAWLAWHGAAALSDTHWALPALLAAMAAATLQVLGDSLLVWAFGTTPGKAACGLRLAASDGGPIPLRAAVVRALKVGLLGLGLWIPPWTAIDLAACLWRVRRRRPLPWERGDAAPVLVARPANAATQAAAWVLAGALLLLSAAALLLAGVGAGGPGLSAWSTQDMRRALTGRWIWVHPLTGREVPLDARWRLVHEARFDRTQSYHVGFALGDGETHLVRLNLQWARAPTDLCIAAELDLEERGFVVTQQHPSPGGGAPACRVRGARLDQGRLVTGEALVRFERDRLQTSVLQQAGDGDETSRRAVASLARTLAEPGDGWQFDAHGPSHFHWRNELSGLSAPLPAAWTADEIVVVPEAALVGHGFVRWRGSDKRGAAWQDAAAVFGLPRGVAQASEVEAALQHLIGNAPADRVERVMVDDRRERLRLVRATGDGFIEVHRRRRHTWLLMWSHNESGDTPTSAEAHELLKPILRTLD